MQEKYVTPNIELVFLECADVVTNSGDNETEFVPDLTAEVNILW